MYNVYRPVRETLATNFRKLTGLPKDSRKDPGFMHRVLNATVHRHPDVLTTVYGMALIDEEDYIHNGCRIYFPENVDLLRQLWAAHMDIVPEDIVAAGVPVCFSVAWPRALAEVIGESLPGCLVWFGGRTDRDQLRDRVFESWGFRPEDVQLIGEPYPDGEKTIHINFHNDSGAPAICRTSYRGKDIAQCLISAKDLGKITDVYGVIEATPLTEAEKRTAWVLLRLVIRMLVYITACPQAVVSGWPSGINHRDAGSGWNRVFDPAKVMDITRVGGSHGSPVMHYRTWHFRRYPVRADGARTPGMVFVRETLVGAEVDPKTVQKIRGTHGHGEEQGRQED